MHNFSTKKIKAKAKVKYTKRTEEMFELEGDYYGHGFEDSFYTTALVTMVS